jgi:16S rRNA (cytidine1402-2'-O)-methyltransferase
MKGTLFLIPVPLAEGSSEKVIPPFHHTVINKLRTYIVENEKTARHWLKVMGLSIPQSELIIHVYGKHSEKEDLTDYFKELEAGNDVGLMSEAGCPAVADPGSDIVAEAHRRNIKISPLTGPNSIIIALMASGFYGQNFTFHGYLPIDKADRARRLKELESISGRLKQTQLFIETPYRNNQMLEDILRVCDPATELCIASDLTSESEQIISLPVHKWRKTQTDLHKKPSIFLLFRRSSFSNR